MKNCRLCGSRAIKEALHLKDMPTNISILYNKKDLIHDRTQDFSVYQCSECGFIQADENKSDAYYKDYLMTVSHVKTMNNYQKKQSADFVNTYKLKGKKIIEAGCGDGNFMIYLKKLGVNVIGIEPSDNFRKLAQKKGFKVFSGYVSQKNPIPGSLYDGFVTRQVLEHVPNVDDFLKGIFKSLKDGAIGLIEVPSMEKTFQNSRFYDFFPDHVNYFTEQTLEYAVVKNGFSVVDFFYGMDKEYINVIVKKETTPTFSNIKKTIDKLIKDVNKFTIFFKKKGLKVGTRGAGAKGLTTLAICKNNNIECIIDSDPHKINKYSPASHINIISPKQLQGLDAIILTAMAYKDEILNDLEKKYKFKGTIAILGNGLEIIRNRHHFK